MKGCGNCYYAFFDERAYPCSLCIRGIKRTDKWMPSKKTKAEIQQVVRLKHFKCPKCGRSDYIRSFEDWGIDGGIYKYKCINCNTYIKDEPQTERRG